MTSQRFGPLHEPKILPIDSVVYYRVYHFFVKDKQFTIGRLAHETGVGVETIRFYEREGLIEAPRRRDSGYREYTDSAVVRILFIRQAKELGFSLAEIKELLSIRISPKKTCANVKAITRTKIADIDAKITALKRIRNALARLAVQCQGGGPVSECPILEALRKPKKRKNREEKL